MSILFQENLDLNYLVSAVKERVITVLEKGENGEMDRDKIEELLKEQAVHNKKMLALARIRTVVTVAIAAVIAAVMIMGMSMVNAVTENLQGIDLNAKLNTAGAIMADLGSIDLSSLQDTMAKIDQLDLGSLQEKMTVLDENLQALQGMLGGPRP